jgi:gliding motility-associated-like protein
VQLYLNAPIQTGGVWNVVLKKGIDGNTLIDECGTEVIAGSKNFVAYDTVNANFNTAITSSCTVNTVSFSHNGAHNVSEWKWTFHDNTNAFAQTVTKNYTEFSPKQVNLIVSNGICNDSASYTLIFDNELKASFTISTDSLCPGEAVTLTNTTIGNVVNWQWNFNDGTTSSAKTPPDHIFPAPPKTRDYIIQLSATNNYGCTDIASLSVKALQSCFVAIPSAFTPNGDGLNDYLYPLNGFKASKLSFKVFNRYGQMVFETTDWNKRWDGKINGQMQPSGTYVWTFDYTDAQTQKQYSYRGTTVLIR